jgi:hypothetical protein
VTRGAIVHNQPVPMKCTPKVESEMDIGRKQAFREYTAFKGVQSWLSRKVASLSRSRR